MTKQIERSDLAPHTTRLLPPAARDVLSAKNYISPEETILNNDVYNKLVLGRDILEVLNIGSLLNKVRKNFFLDNPQIVLFGEMKSFDYCTPTSRKDTNIYKRAATFVTYNIDIPGEQQKRLALGVTDQNTLGVCLVATDQNKRMIMEETYEQLLRQPILALDKSSLFERKVYPPLVVNGALFIHHPTIVAMNKEIHNDVSTYLQHERDNGTIKDYRAFI